jgi:hypothetical protein
MKTQLAGKDLAGAVVISELLEVSGDAVIAFSSEPSV